MYKGLQSATKALREMMSQNFKGIAYYQVSSIVINAVENSLTTLFHTSMQGRLIAGMMDDWLHVGHYHFLE